MSSSPINWKKIYANYCITVGWVDLLASIAISVVLMLRMDEFYFSLSFLLWFWIGRGIRENKRYARFWAVFIAGALLIMLAIGEMFGIGSIRIGFLSFESQTVYYQAIFLFVSVVIILPGLSLLLPRLRKHFGG